MVPITDSYLHCAPSALAIAFDEPYVLACKRLLSKGANLEKPNSWKVKRVLEDKFKITKEEIHYHRPKKPLLSGWMRRNNGEWFVVVDSSHEREYGGSHAGVIRNGEFQDNFRWVGMQYNEDNSARVLLAWKLKEKQTNDSNYV